MTILAALKSRESTCFLCRWIAQDLEKHGQLTSWSPGDGDLSFGNIFPKSGKILHIKLERFSIDNAVESRILSVD